MKNSKIKKGDLVEVLWKDAVQLKLTQKEIDIEINGNDFLADKITFGKFEKECKNAIIIVHEFCPKDDIKDESVDVTVIPKNWIKKINKKKLIVN